MDMPKPPKQIAKYEAFVGSWEGEEKFHPSSWDPGGEATSRTKAKMDLDGMFLLMDWAQKRGRRVTYRGHGVFGWDPAKKGYVMYWFDSTGSGYEGPAVGKWTGNRVVFKQETSHGHGRHTFKFTDDDHYTFTIEHSEDGKKWSKMMTGEYRRKK